MVHAAMGVINGVKWQQHAKSCKRSGGKSQNSISMVPLVKE